MTRQGHIINKKDEAKDLRTHVNSDHISFAEPGGKNFRQERTREVTVSK